MKKVRTQLLATAAVMTLSGAAYAADMGVPMKAPPPAPIPYTNWQGFYVGGLVGVGRLNESAVVSNTAAAKAGNGSLCGAYGTDACSYSATGAVAGVEVGYDWQNRYFVYGVAADWTWTGLKRTHTEASGATFFTHQAKVDWLASFRGRMGLAVDDTLVYFTGGLALAELKSNASVGDAGGVTGSVGLNKTQVGWVAGLGVEHKFNQNWSIKAEYLYYDLGHASANSLNTEHTGVTYTTDFFHEIHVGRVGLVYHW
jgi:outer membrane immunogenic protein